MLRMCARGGSLRSGKKVELISVIPKLRQCLEQVRRAGKTIGLVPTMGALHQGHGRLIETAVAQSGCVVVSIFVNPIQFNQQEDFEKYPRALEEDLEFCEAHGVDIVFAPPVGEMYPEPLRTHVEVSWLTDHLCGAFRPGHFRGVTTVVAKLFNIVQPDRAYFGEKDAQQLAVIRRMVRDLNIPIAIVAVPTVREGDGLAVSSRNVRLTPEHRRTAPLLYQALLTVAQAIESGLKDPVQARARALALIERAPEIRLEYLEIVDPENMQPVRSIEGPVRVAAAVWLGGTRLIDNVLAKPANR